MKLTFIILAMLLGKFSISQKTNQLLEEGNAQFQKNEFVKAGELYEDVLKDQPDNLIAEYNLGITNYKMGDIKKAANFFTKITKQPKDKNLAEKSYYNLGVLFLKTQKLQQAATAFKNALKLDTKDTESRENLQLVLNKLKEQSQPKQQQKNKNNNQQSKKNQSNFNKQTAEQLLNNLDHEEEKFSDSLLSKKRALQQEETKNW
jgi:Ca-activated chloride channel family protein